MSRDEIQRKIDALQQELQQIGNQLLLQNPVACKVIGKIEAYKELLGKDVEGNPSAG